jgi:hypothetical protein
LNHHNLPLLAALATVVLWAFAFPASRAVLLSLGLILREQVRRKS